MRALFLIALVAGGCADPTFHDGNLACAADTRECPDGFYCAGDGRCWQTGHGPDLALPDLGAADATAIADAATVDQAPAFCGGPSSCDRDLGVLLCEGWEHGLNGVYPWSRSEHSGTIAVEGAPSCRGGFALHSHTDHIDAGTNYVEGSVEIEPAQIPNPLYVRAFVYASAAIAGDGDHLLTVRQNFGTFSGAALGLFDGNLWLFSDQGIYDVQGIAAPLNRWMCLEWELTGGLLSNSGATSSRVWLDGVEVPTLDDNQDLMVAPAANAIRIGISDLPVVDTPALDTWFDEVILDDKPIGCSK